MTKAEKSRINKLEQELKIVKKQNKQILDQLDRIEAAQTIQVLPQPYPCYPDHWPPKPYPWVSPFWHSTSGSASESPIEGVASGSSVTWSG